jgi:hypothetical protein
MASEIIGCDDYVVVNLFPRPTRNVTEIALLGKDPQVWVEARPTVVAGLATCNEVLLGYRLSEPGGEARLHHRDQTTWIISVLQGLGRSAWTVGGRPRHPSRWQRHTSRAHPNLRFREALTLSLNNGAYGP